jgi:hypothetical protein
VWVRRAAAALALERVEPGTEAAEHLRALNALSSADPATRALIVRLNRAGWLKEGAHAAAVAEHEASERAAKDAEARRVAEQRERDEAARLAAERQRKIADAQAALPNAISKGDAALVESCLEAGASPTNVLAVDLGGYGGDGGHSPMVCAAYYGHVSVMAVLLRAGASADTTCLEYAIQGNHTDAVAWALRNGAEIDFYIYHTQIPCSATAEVTRVLVENGLEADDIEFAFEMCFLQNVRPAEKVEPVARVLLDAGANRDEVLKMVREFIREYGKNAHLKHWEKFLHDYRPPKKSR